MRILLTTFVAFSLLAGCTGKSGDTAGITGVNAIDAATIHGERSAFDTAEDPPISADTHFAAGQLAEANNDPANAIKQYKSALSLDPKHRKSLYRQAVCLSQLKKHNEAVAAWKQYIEATDGGAKGYSNLGFCHELAGRIDEAEAAYLRGIAKDPKNVACRTNYGLMLARLGRTAEATLQLQAVLTPAEVHYNLASVLEHQGRKEAAKAEYERALQLDPQFLDAQTRLSGLQ